MACDQTWEREQLIDHKCGDAFCGGNVLSVDLLERIKSCREAEQRVKDAGGDKYQQLKARLTWNGQLGEDIVIYAIRSIKDVDEVRSFVTGFIAENGDVGFVTSDIQMALALHFTNPDTHKLWNGVIDATLAA
jgi:hypothetical protein